MSCDRSAGRVIVWLAFLAALGSAVVTLAAPNAARMREDDPTLLHFQLTGPEWEDVPAGYLGSVPETVVATLDVPKTYLDRYYYRWFEVEPKASFIDLAVFYPSMQPASVNDTAPPGQYRISASVTAGRAAGLDATIRMNYLATGDWERKPEWDLPGLCGYIAPKETTSLPNARHYLSCMPEIPVLIGHCSPKRGDEPQPGCSVIVPVDKRLRVTLDIHPFELMSQLKDIDAAFKDLILSFVVSEK